MGGRADVRYCHCPSRQVGGRADVRYCHCPSRQVGGRADVRYCHHNHNNSFSGGHLFIYRGYIGFTPSIRPSVPHPVSAL